MSVQGEIDRINGGVADIKAAITEKGGTVADGAKVDQLGAAVRAIPDGTGGITQEEADARYMPILGKTYKADELFSITTKNIQGTESAAITNFLGLITLVASGGYVLSFGTNSDGEAVITTQFPEKWREALGVSDGGVSANDIYPVNSVKMWYDNEDHSNFLGFTWVRCLQNRFPAGIGGEAEFASIGQTGGEKTHALTTSEAPPIDSGNYLITGGTRERWIDGYNGSAGQPHNNLPPYEVVSFWRRTA